MSTKTATTSYEASAGQQQRAASSGYAQEISRAHAALLKLTSRVKADTVEAANTTRQIGLQLQAWMNHEQMKFETFEKFVRDHAGELPKGLNSAAARKFISAHRNYPDDIEDVKTAVAVLTQMTLFAVGIMEEPKRLVTQTASGRGPFESLMTLWAKQREAMQKFTDENPPAKWTENIWRTVLDETKDAADLHEQARQKLKTG